MVERIVWTTAPNGVECGTSVVVMHDGDYFVAYSLALDLSTTGDAIEDAFANFREALSLHLECVTEDGVLRLDRDNLGGIFLRVAK